MKKSVFFYIFDGVKKEKMGGLEEVWFSNVCVFFFVKNISYSELRFVIITQMVFEGIM
jgi:hypothetical protein